MTHTRIARGFTCSSMLLGALLFAACGSNNKADSGPDGGPDTGADAEMLDTGHDAGHFDLGLRDTGGGGDAGDQMPNQEGHSCIQGPNGQPPYGSCMDTTNVCFGWGGGVFSCVKGCTTNADCTASKVGSTCASILFDPTFNDGTPGGGALLKACVASAVNTEGAIITTTLLHQDMSGAQVPLTGCADPLIPIYQGYGSGLLDLPGDQSSCARRCNADMECMGSFPSCTLDVFTSTQAGFKTGLCMTRKASKGAKCSMRHATEMCDMHQTQDFVCSDIGANDADTKNATDNAYGVCLELCETCDAMNPCPQGLNCTNGLCALPTKTACMAKADTAHSGSCKTGFFRNPRIGVCSDSCISYPDDCVGMGSPPPMGGTANGARCFEFGTRNGGTLDKPIAGVCVDVEQVGPLLPALTVVAGPFDAAFDMKYRCSDVDPNTGNVIPPYANEIQCPKKTSCLLFPDANNQPHSGCVYGCSTTTSTFATSGCAGTMTTTCAAIFQQTNKVGICEKR